MGPLLRRAGPYVALEILMPGGTMLAIMLYLYQRRRAQLRAGVAPNAVDRAGLAVLRVARGALARLPALGDGLRHLPRVRAMI